MDETVKREAIKKIEKALEKEFPPVIMSHRIFTDIVEPLLEQETEKWRSLAYAIPAD